MLYRNIIYSLINYSDYNSIEYTYYICILYRNYIKYAECITYCLSSLQDILKEPNDPEHITAILFNVPTCFTLLSINFMLVIFAFLKPYMTLEIMCFIISFISLPLSRNIFNNLIKTNTGGIRNVGAISGYHDYIRCSRSPLHREEQGI